MKLYKIFLLLLLSVFTLAACKKEANPQSISLNISGMTCEIGCAKLIQSKLSKKEGITKAKVIFKDSIAKVDFDLSTISKKEIIGVIEGIADGDLYKATEIEVQK
jgi:copper chaperone CopZ